MTRHTEKRPAFLAPLRGPDPLIEKIRGRVIEELTRIGCGNPALIADRALRKIMK